MATLSKANMVTGNTITAADVTQLVDAFTAGGGYSVSISGSVTGSATTANTATSASYAVTSSYVLNTVSSSYSTTSSFALNAGTPTTLGDQYNQRLGSGVGQSNFEFIAGAVQLGSYSGSSDAFPVLAGRNLNINAFITTTVHTVGASAIITNIDGGGRISFTGSGGSGADVVTFTGIVTS